MIPILLIVALGVTLQWDANTEEDLAGYNIYRSQESSVYTTPLNSELIIGTQHEDLTPLPLIQYYYVATAVDTEDLESDYSNEVFYLYACPGDSNMDGIVDIADSVLIRRYVVGLEILTAPAKKAADVNGDGIVDIADSVMINRYVVGLDVLEECP